MYSDPIFHIICSATKKTERLPRMIYEVGSFDKYIFLLSSDWCTPFILNDLDVSDDDYLDINKSAKITVKQIMGSSFDSQNHNYYEISFEKTRLKETWSTFSKNLNNPILLEKITSYIYRLSALGNHESGIHQGLLWDIVCDIKLNENYFLNQNIANEKVKEIENLIFELKINDLYFFENLQVKSNSLWDQYLMTTHPGQPTAICDFYKVAYEKTVLKKFWISTQKILTNSEFEALENYLFSEFYSEYGEFLSTNDGKFSKPTWMDNRNK